MIGIIYTVISMFMILKKENKMHNYRESIIIALMSLICLLFCMFKMIVSDNMADYLYIAVFSWIMILAYIDNVSGYVYDITEYYGIVIVMIAVAKIISELGYVSLNRFVIILICVLLYFLGAKLNIFGMGDADIFAVLSLVFADLMLSIMFYVVTCALFILRNIKELIIQRGKLNKPRPLIPSIYMAYVLFIPFLL